jgi:O-glycosyl hydrolase
MMRDYDGNGSAFGDTSISANSANTAELTVYAAQRSTDNAVTILVVNSSTTAYTSALSIAGIVDTQPVSVYTYASTNSTAIVHEPSLPGGATVTASLPAQSITMLVVPSGSTPLSTARPKRR